MIHRAKTDKTARQSRAARAERLENRVLLSAEPLSELAGVNGTIAITEETVTARNVTSEIIPVTFFGNVDVSTFSNSNFTVSEGSASPLGAVPVSGVQVAVAYVGLDPADPGPGQGERIADYTIFKSDAFASDFMPAEDGTYSLSLQANQVIDTQLVAFAATTPLAALDVNVPPGPVGLTTTMQVNGQTVNQPIADTGLAYEDTTVDFGQTLLQDQGQVKAFTLTNTNLFVATVNVTLNGSDVNTPGANYTPFELDPSTPIPATLQPQQSATFNIIFNAPDSQDATHAPLGKVTGNFIVDATAPDPSISPDRIVFTATGVLLKATNAITRGAPFSFTDAAGDKATLKLSGPGQAVLAFPSNPNEAGGEADPSTLTLTGTTNRTHITLVAKHAISLGTVTGGSFDSFIGKTTTLAGNWAIDGSVGTISVGAISDTWNASIAGSLDHLIVTGSASGNLAAMAIGSIHAGSLDGANYFAGASFGANGVVNGGDDTGAAGSIGSITVSGNVTASSICAGLVPFDGNFLLVQSGNINVANASGNPLNMSDQLTGAAKTSKIGPIRVHGTLDTGTKLLAEGYSTARIAGKKVNPVTDSHFANGGI